MDRGDVDEGVKSVNVDKTLLPISLWKIHGWGLA